MSLSLETKLAILQQSEYEWPRYQHWLSEHDKESIVVLPKKWTLKLKLLSFLAPVLSLRGALALLMIPQTIVTTMLVSAARLKIRYLQSKGLIVVAIAGSYAKTSTKYIANHLLVGSKEVLMTPENINTPIGIARCILSTLSAKQNVFIAELGEYYPGDIRELVKFLSPVYKILTPVGYAHLERFGSAERLKAGLEELRTTQPEKGKTYVHGVDYDASALKNVQVSRAGTEFEFDGQTYFIPLFGTHNAVNTLPGIWLANELGIEAGVIQSRLATVPTIPHRLEPTQLEHNILLLDNGYNSNPASAKESLAVLKALESPQKIVCTPGFVELGPSQAQENENFGTAITQVAQVCIVIEGVNSDALIRGLKSGGFGDDQIITAAGEEEGMTILSKRTQPSAIILFENSIPELYKKKAVTAT